MTKEEAILKLRTIHNKLGSLDNYDEENAHCEADDILLSLLEDMGCKEVVEVFNSIPKWYA